jgi:hypothetical protein
MEEAADEISTDRERTMEIDRYPYHKALFRPNTGRHWNIPALPDIKGTQPRSMYYRGLEHGQDDRYIVNYSDMTENQYEAYCMGYEKGKSQSQMVQLLRQRYESS